MASLARTNARQSRTAGPHHIVDGGDVGPPRLALAREHPPAKSREPIEAAVPRAGLLDPAALDPAPRLQAQERGIERRQREGQPSARSRLDELADLIAVARPILDQGEDQHVQAALLDLGREGVHMRRYR